MATPAAFAARLRPLRTIRRVVYAKRPFGGPEQVLDYLGRYTHRVAIANSRLVSLTEGRVSFRWKDYRHHNKQKVMTLVRVFPAPRPARYSQVRQSPSGAFCSGRAHSPHWLHFF